MTSHYVEQHVEQRPDPGGETTAVLPQVGDRGPDVGDRMAGAVADARERVTRLDLSAKLAWAGALLTTLAFLVLPYAGNRGPAVEIGGRLWWRPILAIAAAVLVTAAHRAYAGTTAVVAVAVAAAAVSEAGLFALVSSNTGRLGAGFFLMLIGAVLTLVASFRAATRP